MQPETLTLGFDTSAAHCAAALLSGNRVVDQRLEEMTKGQAERLLPMIEDMLKQSAVEWSDIGVIGVGVGPGNFTGIRISVSAARGLALALDIPAVGVSTFEAQAEGIDRPVASLVDARRGQVYLQILHPGGTTPPRTMSRDDAERMIAAEGLNAVGAGLGGEPAPVAVGIARLAARRQSLNPGRPAPLYIRPADAAPPRDPAPVILP